LALGLGGGTVVELINKYWPKAKFIGIELDPEIVRVGKKHFNLGKFNNLHIIVDDAFSWLTRYHVLKHDNKRFDLMIVDLYLGNNFPQKAASEKFMKNVQKILSKDGMVIFNRLKSDKTSDFEAKLAKIFTDVKLVKTTTNHFFLARS
jgi:spermidine synthase